MKPTKEMLKEYAAIAKKSNRDMKECIKAHLVANCPKFAGHEDKFERCISYLEECASEILEGKNGDVPDEVCFRICRDYFNDEIWKKEDEEEARKKAEAEERARLAAEKKAKDKKGKKAKNKAEKGENRVPAPSAAEPVEPAPEKAEPEKEKFPTCRVCGKEFINLYKDGMCVDCYEKKPMQAEKSAPAHAAKIQPEPGQLDFFDLMVA